MAIRKYLVEPYQQAALAYLCPPEDLSVSEWAEKYRILDNKTSNISGPWSNDLTPYLVGIMDEFTNYHTEEIILAKCTQVGGTEALLNMLGYIIQQDPSPTMIVYPSDDVADLISMKRISPMIEAAPTLRKHLLPNDSARRELVFDSMYLSLTGSKSPADLAAQAMRFLFLDEVDKFPGASKKEADPISLARERTKTFRNNRKILIISTPTLRTGHIWKALQGADVEKHYFVPCPHCGEKIELKFSQIKFPDEEGMSYKDRAEFACYVCQSCGAVITDQDKPEMLRHGEWRVVRSQTQHPKKVAFWINTLYSPFVTFSDIAGKFLETKDDPEEFQNFVNSWLAEPWEDTKLKTSADLVLERQTDLPEFTVPGWAKILTGGVDVQENCVYWTIRAFGNYFTSQNIAHGQAHSFREIERIMNLQYKKEDGTPMIVQLALIDSGDNTDSVYEFCASNMEWSLPCKGASHPMTTHFKRSTVNKAESSAYGMQLILIDVDKYKDMIAGRMRKNNGVGSWMVYQGCDEEYAKQVTAEHKVNVRTAGGRTQQKWVQKESHADNHYLDTEVYAMCTADMLGARSFHLDEVEPPKKQPEPEKKTEPENDWIGAGGGSWL